MPLAWEDLVYNEARSPKTLRVEDFGTPSRRWKQRSHATLAPARRRHLRLGAQAQVSPTGGSAGVASGLTDHIWAARERLKTIVPPNPKNT